MENKIKLQTAYIPVDVKDRLPEKNGRYFVTCDNGIEDGNIFINGFLGESEIGKTETWLEKQEGVFLTKDEFEQHLASFWNKGYAACKNDLNYIDDVLPFEQYFKELFE
jgi:hypothetical protein